MKKTIAIVLALIMVAAFAVTASAAEIKSETPTQCYRWARTGVPGEGSLVIQGQGEGQTMHSWLKFENITEAMVTNLKKVSLQLGSLESVAEIGELVFDVYYLTEAQYNQQIASTNPSATGTKIGSADFSGVKKDAVPAIELDASAFTTAGNIYLGF